MGSGPAKITEVIITKLAMNRLKIHQNTTLRYKKQVKGCKKWTKRPHRDPMSVPGRHWGPGPQRAPNSDIIFGCHLDARRDPNFDQKHARHAKCDRQIVVVLILLPVTAFSSVFQRGFVEMPPSDPWRFVLPPQWEHDFDKITILENLSKKCFQGSDF